MLFSLFYLLRLNRVRFKYKRFLNKKTRIKRINTNLLMTVNKQAKCIGEKIREIRAYSQPFLLCYRGKEGKQTISSNTPLLPRNHFS